MPYEMTIGLNVTDRDKYQQYRAEIAPLMQAAGAKFRYDFEVARTLTSEATTPINRVFVIQFPDRATKERFFADPRYLEIRGRLFETSVQGFPRLAENGG